MKLSIIGTGHVGLVTGACFAEKGHHVLCVDSDRTKIDTIKKRKMPIYEPGLDELVLRHIDNGRLTFGYSVKEAVDYGNVIFVCVGTPASAEGHADMYYIELVARETGEALKEYRLIVDKSTVPVKTGGKVSATIARYAKKGIEFDVASNPEFLREGSAIDDTLNPDRIVIGVDSKRSEKLLREVYAGFPAPMIVTDIKSAELIKHAANSFLSMKISYANTLALICELAGADVRAVVNGMGMDKRIGRSFLNAGIGYGGYCFPKDVEAFAAISKELGYDFKLLEEVQAVNAGMTGYLVKKIEKTLWVLKGKRIGALGLSFKPDTDDIRSSPAIAVIRQLVEKGAIVNVYDPKSMEKAKKVLTGVQYCADIYEAAKDADCLAILTEWGEFKNMDLERLRKTLRHPIIVDGRNIFDPEEMARKEFTYLCVGKLTE